MIEYNFDLVSFVTAFIIGIPFGLVFPARPRYLFIDMFAGVIFFSSIILVRFVEGNSIIDIVFTGIMYITFLVGALVATRFNRVAQQKEKLIKRLENDSREEL